MKPTGIFYLIINSILLVGVGGCFKQNSNQPLPPLSPPVSVNSNFVTGADISWVTEMEAAGKKFYNPSGGEEDLFSILKKGNLNTVRLRVWVNPLKGFNGEADLVAKAMRAKNAGYRILIDFHYSDTWADPGQQAKPAAWAALDMAGLKGAITNHTTSVLSALKKAGIHPEWVQVGNETNDGMLWPEGKASTNMANFAQMINAGYDAVKSVFPSAKVMVHISNGWDNNLFRWLLDGLKKNGGKWDLIGMSLYPSPTNWPTLNAQCAANMNDLISRYGKEIMIVEVGMRWDEPSACNSFLTDLILKVKAVPDNKGLGVIYWEPEAYNNWQGYTLGAFDNTGKPTIALNAFK